jgi:hypothetical protein
MVPKKNNYHCLPSSFQNQKHYQQTLKKEHLNPEVAKTKAMLQQVHTATMTAQASEFLVSNTRAVAP